MYSRWDHIPRRQHSSITNNAITQYSTVNSTYSTSRQQARGRPQGKGWSASQKGYYHIAKPKRPPLLSGRAACVRVCLVCRPHPGGGVARHDVHTSNEDKNRPPACRSISRMNDDDYDSHHRYHHHHRHQYHHNFTMVLSRSDT